jgi:predicted DNA binding CopG/RHH family protein
MKTKADYKKTDFDYELDDEEAELLQAIDKGDFKVIPYSKKERKELQATAKSFSEMKRKSINIRIPEYNLTRIRRQAEKKGLPYQTLINSILQQYLEKIEQYETAEK